MQLIVNQPGNNQQRIFQQRSRRRKVCHLAKTLARIAASNQYCITQEQREKEQHGKCAEINCPWEPTDGNEQTNGELRPYTEPGKHKTDIKWEETKRVDIKLKLINAEQLGQCREYKQNTQEHPEHYAQPEPASTHCSRDTLPGAHPCG